MSKQFYGLLAERLFPIFGDDRSDKLSRPSAATRSHLKMLRHEFKDVIMGNHPARLKAIWRCWALFYVPDIVILRRTAIARITLSQIHQLATELLPKRDFAKQTIGIVTRTRGEKKLIG